MATRVETAESKPRAYRRFTPAQRFEHMVTIVTFVGLALTGIPQKYAGEAWARTMIDVMGGIEGIRVVHRVMATVLMGAAIYHGGVITYKLWVLGRRATMMPGLRDLRDAIHWVLFNLGLRREHPRMPRYNFGEKAEYLALVWGTLVMIATGFMLWNPITTANVLPGEVIPAARVAHGNEALLAVASIIIWHMYSVHIRRFNRAMFTGKLSREAMLEEHAEELAQIESGQAQHDPDPEVVRRRARAFWPYATVMTIILVGGLIWFVSHERTALATAPVPVAVDSAAITVSEDMGDPVQGAEDWQSLDCQSCHGANAEGTERAMGAILAGTQISFGAFVTSVRYGPADMPAYPPEAVSDEQLAHLYAWLHTLGGPAAPGAGAEATAMAEATEEASEDSAADGEDTVEEAAPPDAGDDTEDLTE